jgi:2-phospho-L-lactate guanylyltransferase (CobY/MobA/RfbA family)
VSSVNDRFRLHSHQAIFDAETPHGAEETGMGKYVLIRGGTVVNADNAAAGAAAIRAIENSASTLLVVHADIPILRKSELDLLFKSCDNHNVVIAESTDGGTNAVILSPPTP